ncbi:hypothetical protein MLD38_037683 [Melastoma candidum]|uniref:Uncharacterized protein n=1 Tax=Melastoma candidum TaxID=119954 RepID=A0ACB9LP38_9MYRT|nr:hypothetical protein MLD38_037683 [Melastoma candidum]
MRNMMQVYLLHSPASPHSLLLSSASPAGKQMVSAPYVASLRDMWVVWNIRGLMILSLSMQLLLAIISLLRRKTSNRWVMLMIWSAYFLSDWAAIFAFGLISNARLKNPTSPLQVDQDLLAFWSAFLLIHLGGPDSITAYALEDNTLWMRHLVGLVVQILAFLNIFVKTLPDNKLRVPTILIAIAGTIKYGERTRALYLASVENLKESVLKSRRLQLKSNITRPQGASTQSNIDASNNGEDTLKKRLEMAFHYFQIFRGLVVDMMPEHSEWLENRDCFLNKDARETFEILKMELKLFYEVFYTKVLAANSAWGVLIRSLAFYNILVALIMFCLIEKTGIHGVDVRITYSLLAGVIALDSASEILLVWSNWSMVDSTFAGCQMLGHGLVLYWIVGVAISGMVGCFVGLCCRTVAFRDWSESTGAVSILGRAFEESRPSKGSKLSGYWRKINGKINDKMGVVILTKLPYQWKNNLDMELWDFVFSQLKEKALPADDVDKE